MPWPAASRASSAVSTAVARRQDPRQHQATPERLAELALVVVAGLDADGRGVQAHEQESVAQRRQVGEGRGRDAVDVDGREMRARRRVDG